MKIPHPIRQAALVLAKLDRDARDAVLDRMPADHARRLRDALLTLHTDDLDEQEVAIQDFLAAQGVSAHAMSAMGLSDYEMAKVRSEPKRIFNTDNLSSSLRDLLAHSNQALANTVAYERATTIAALLSAIPGDRAAGILKLLIGGTRTRVLAILDTGVDPHPKAIEAIAEWICDHLVDSSMEPTVSMRHRSALKAILDEFSADERQAMLDDLANENPMLARRLSEETSTTSAASSDCYC